MRALNTERGIDDCCHQQPAQENLAAYDVYAGVMAQAVTGSAMTGLRLID